MANKSRFVIAESNIKAFFRQGPKKVFSAPEIRGIFEDRRSVWNLPSSWNSEKFIEQILKREVLKLEKIVFEGYAGEKERFVEEGASAYQLAVSLMSKSYLSHYTAVFLNGLTTQIPKVIYISFEQSIKPHTDRTLKQDAIDMAFSKPQRIAGTKAIYQDYTFILLNAMHSGRQGVTTVDDVQVTGIERTLIDITVRPNYAGGVDAVLEAYKNALPNISINKLLATLESMNFIYPYHQSVGFYLERAGYTGKKMDELRRQAKDFDFYLTYEIRDKAYSKDWRLFYPKGM